MPTYRLNINGSFDGTGTSNTTEPNGNERANEGDFNVSISGTWTGVIELQRDFSKSTGDAVSWDTVEIFTGTSVPTTDFVAKVGKNAGINVRYRFEATTLSSGEAFFKATQ